MLQLSLTPYVYLFKAYHEVGNRDSVVDIRTRLQAGRSGVWTQAGKNVFYLLQKHPEGAGAPTASRAMAVGASVP